MRRVRKGTRLVFVPGNHDECIRDYIGLQFGGIEIHQDIVHTTAAGRRYVVMHGDEFDVVVRTAKWLAFLGDRGYELALWLNNPLNWVRRHLGLGYWSLSAYLKYRVKSAVAFIGAFEEAVATEAHRRNVDGVICGHIHHAADRTFSGVHYLNCGDWVESCTALIETRAGELRVVHWRPEGGIEPLVVPAGRRRLPEGTHRLWPGWLCRVICGPANSRGLQRPPRDASLLPISCLISARMSAGVTPARSLQHSPAMASRKGTDRCVVV